MKNCKDLIVNSIVYDKLSFYIKDAISQIHDSYLPYEYLQDMLEEYELTKDECIIHEIEQLICIMYNI